MPLSSVSTGQQTAATQLNQLINLLTGVMNDQAVTIANTLAATAVQASGLSGATATGRYVGVTSSGAPASGTFAVGDWVTTRDGRIWMCTVAGSPGTWVQPSPPPNTNPANIQPIGTVAAAGSTGLSADAGHVHTGGGLVAANNVWTGVNQFGGSFAGSAVNIGPLQAKNISGLGNAQGNTVGVAEFGGISTNEVGIGVRLYREAAGSDWQTTSVVLSLDVDNSYAAGTRLALDHNKYFGINTETPAYLFDLINPSGSRVALIDSSGNMTLAGALTATNVNGVTGIGGAAQDLGWGSSSAGASAVAARYDHQHQDHYLVRAGAASAPSDTEAKHLWTANSRNDSYVSNGDILFNV